jgi:hypothetical protein
MMKKDLEFERYYELFDKLIKVSKKDEIILIKNFEEQKHLFKFKPL